MLSPGIILLHLSGQLQAEEHASYTWASLGDRTSPMQAACLTASAGATRENSTLMLGFSSPKELELCLSVGFFICDSGCLESQLGCNGEPLLMLG